MSSKIQRAIREKKVIRFYYESGNRTVEPFCFGVSSAGNNLLRGFQIDGFSKSGD
ncbi:MAG: hypothetical protein KAW12_20050 [Candidatus Aminicenantes bacterium]|nr:hypothetical protein [Candidatus Aminicenantes bacterium]